MKKKISSPIKKSRALKHRKEIVHEVVSSGASSRYIADKAVQIIIHTGMDKRIDNELASGGVFDPKFAEKLIQKRWYSDIFSQAGDIRSILEIVAFLYALYRIKDITRLVIGTLSGESKIRGTVIHGNRPKSPPSVQGKRSKSRNVSPTGSEHGSS